MGYIVACHLVEGSLKLVDFKEIPIHLKKPADDEEELKLEEIHFFKIELGQYDPVQKSIEIGDIKLFGEIGSAKCEITLVDQWQKEYLFEDYVRMDENVQKLINDRVYSRGRFEVKKEGQWTVETQSDKFLLYVDEKR